MDKSYLKQNMYTYGKLLEWQNRDIHSNLLVNQLQISHKTLGADIVHIRCFIFNNENLLDIK